MNRENATNVYPSWVIDGDDSLAPSIYEAYELSGYDPNGSDLRVESYSDRLAYALELKHQGELREGGIGDGMRYEAANLLKGLQGEAETMRDELKQRLEELSERDKLYAHAIQDWTLLELERRIAGRGYDYEATDERTYLETIDVLGSLVDELRVDDEDEQLIELAETWRNEVAAELTVKNVRSFYDLAA